MKSFIEEINWKVVSGSTPVGVKEGGLRSGRSRTVVQLQ